MCVVVQAEVAGSSESEPLGALQRAAPGAEETEPAEQVRDQGSAVEPPPCTQEPPGVHCESCS